MQENQHQREEFYPWDDVQVDRNSRWLQVKHSPEDAKAEYLLRASPCPKCKTLADQLSWLCFRVRRSLSPPLNPLRRGWLTVCDQCHVQVDFFMEEQEFYGWDEVNTCKKDASLQSQHPLEGTESQHVQNAIDCPRCGAEPNQLSWIYFRGEWGEPRRTGWLTVCEKCKMQIDFFVEKQEYYPWEGVNASRNDKSLQSEHSVEKAKSEYLAYAMSCPKCKTPADQLSWFYLSSSRESWDALAGRAGWMIVCDECSNQVDFFLEMMS